MRTTVLVLALAFLVVEWSTGRVELGRAALSAGNSQPHSVVNDFSPQVDFDLQIKPILQSKCMPCHFKGGQMYVRLPFDRADTIRKLGEKLFTRIKDEDQRRIIREFLAQSE
jgi:hypothetical protein